MRQYLVGVHQMSEITKLFNRATGNLRVGICVHLVLTKGLKVVRTEH